MNLLLNTNDKIMIWNSFDYAPIITMVVLYQIITILTSSLRTKQNYGQKRDPRSVALAGATTTIADGSYSVGFNPVLIAFQKDKPFMIQVGGLDFGL